MLKRVILNILKILFAVGIIYWLVQNDKLSYKETRKLFTSSQIIIAVIPLYLLQLLIVSRRWQILLQLKSKHLNLKRIVMIQWIGLLFSSVLPGAVTGDLIKLRYVKKLDESLSAKFLVLSAFLDRLFGLVALLLISGFSSLIYYSDLVSLSSEMPKMIVVNFLLLIASFMVIAIFLIPHSLIDSISRIMPIKKLSKLIESLKLIHIEKSKIAKLLMMSVFSQLLIILCFHLINYSFYQTSIRIRDLATIIPLGIITTAIPISPSGLGVGHLAFQKLFSFINQTNGATLFNNFWIIFLLMNLIGVIPYIFSKQRK